MKKSVLLLIAITFTFLFVKAQTSVTGTVLDNKTGEPLHSAVIKLKSKQNEARRFNTITGLDGSFVLKTVPAGNYELEIKYVGYKEKEVDITVSDAPVKLELAVDQKGEQLHEVTVTASKDRGSDLSSLIADRRAPSIQNSVSARTIEVSPDLSVANVTQRISGVSIERSTNGEGQYAIVRGMDKRYNYTLVNGIKIPSPDNKNRYIPLDIFPADLLDRLEVSKALTPNMEGDAIGGVVNMVMKDAPPVFSVKANAALGYAQKFSSEDFNTFDHSASLNHSPRYINGNSYNAPITDFPKNNFSYGTKSNPLASLLGLSVGGRLFKNRLGVIVAGSFQNNYRNISSLFYGTETELATGNAKLTDIERRNYSIQQQRTGLHTKLDYRINDKNKINLYAAYFNLLKNEYRYATDTNLVLGRTVPGSGRVENQYRTYRDVQKIFNVTLNGEHELAENLKMNWSAVYSKASDNRPDQATLNLVTGVSVDSAGKFVQAPLNIDLHSPREWLYSSDEDKSGYLNFTYKSTLAGINADWTVGGMYRDKSRNSYYDTYDLRPDPSNQIYNGNISTNSFSIFNPQGTSTDALNYTAKEKVSAAYAMVKLQSRKVEVVGGARYENTNLSWNTAVDETVLGKTGSIKYYDVLPSAHIKYSPGKKQAIRLSYFSSISRPNFYEVIPHYGGDPDADYKEKGNPNLKRTTADNFDLRYEYFPKALDQLLVGLFYKNIKNPIEYALLDEGTNTYYMPANFGTAHNYGFELDFTKFFRQFGIRANYTYTDSKITTSKILRYSNGSNFLTKGVDQSRPLQGQSKHIANFSLLFKDDARLGLNAQLAFGYTSRRINTVSQFLDNDLWQKGFAQMDFSFEKRVAKRWFIYGKINNILNTPYQLELLQKNDSSVTGLANQKAGDNVFVRKDTYGINYLLGVKFKL